MRLNRLQKAARAIEDGAKLEFDYMRLGSGRRSLEHRLVNPLSVSSTREGRTVVTAEDFGREGNPRSFRLERMFHVNLT